jgi:Fic/DOC family protein
MATELIGYARLVDKHALPARPLTVSAVIDTAVKGRTSTVAAGKETLRFEPKYRPEDAIEGDLQFALKYEGLNLEVLALLFAKTGKLDIEAWLAGKPASGVARRVGFLYEWLTGEQIKATVPPKTGYLPVLDEELQFASAAVKRNAKFRVLDNLPGNQNFCALVRKTPFLRGMVQKDLRRHAQDKLSRYDPDLLRRAAAYLYLKETHSSFEVEREKPSSSRAQRFADLLRDAQTGKPLSEDRLVELQNAVVDPRFREFSYRTQQNWVGQDLGYRNKIDFVPPRPEDVPSLMQGIVALSEAARSNPESIDPVALSATLAFGFVFIHPFMDGNGRIHRYLIHEALSMTGFTPKGMVLPVSAVILANLDDYVNVLERFSKPMLARTSYNPEHPASVATGNDALYFRYFDATDQVAFLYRALERTIDHDLETEIDFLIAFDQARGDLNKLADWPDKSLDLFIRLVHQNNYALSEAKHRAHFAWMSDEEAKNFSDVVKGAFLEVAANRTRQANDDQTTSIRSTAKP